jgi:two-component SAPR family response regulator
VEALNGIVFDRASHAGVRLRHSPTRILVVESEPQLAIILDSAISDFGYHVVGPIENLKAATYLAATERIDAAVVDTTIDGTVAKYVADRLLARRIPFVFVDSHVPMSGMRYHAIPRLLKPFTIDDLHRTIVQLLKFRNPSERPAVTA